MQDRIVAASADTWTLIQAYVPSLIGAVLLLVIGWFLATFLSRMVERGLEKTKIDARIRATMAEGNDKPPQAGLLANIARGAVIVLAFAMGLEQMGIGEDIIALAFGLILGALAIAAAIAFGIGGRDVAAELVADWRNKLSRKKPLPPN